MTRKLTKDQITAIPSLLNEGFSARKIAKTLGRHEVTIYRWIRRLKAEGYQIPRLYRGSVKVDIKRAE
jgi:transposase